MAFESQVHRLMYGEWTESKGEKLKGGSEENESQVASASVD